MAHAGKLLCKIVASCLGDFCEEAGVLPKEQCCFRPQRSRTDVIFIVHRLQKLGGASNTDNTRDLTEGVGWYLKLVRAYSHSVAGSGASFRNSLREPSYRTDLVVIPRAFSCPLVHSQ